VTTYPDSWVEHYIDRNYVHVDPLISEGPKRMVPFLWDEVARPDLLDRKQRALYGEAAGLGIAGGLSIPIHGRNGEFAMMSVAPDRELGAAGLAALRHQIHLLSMYYHNCTGSIILEQLMKTPRQKDVLTDREKECLRWSAIGKSAADIAGILNISRTTVIYYIENAKRKLDVFSTTHAVVKAMALHLITLD
jgi:DNA-binding CsgD family transcriptional regulator